MNITELHNIASNLRQAVVEKTKRDPGKGWSLDQASKVLGFKSYNQACANLSKETLSPSGAGINPEVQLDLKMCEWMFPGVTPENIIFHGVVKTNEVFVNGAGLTPIDPAQLKSPTGFAWGYGGSGPTALAMTIANTFFEHTDWDIEEAILVRFVAKLEAHKDFSVSLLEIFEAVRREPKRQ